MLLKEFRIRCYRSIEDSGTISVSRLTAIIGRNESGKSNLLKALHYLNPVGDEIVLNESDTYPRHLKSKDYNDSIRVVYSEWELSEEDKEELSEIWPNAESANRVRISRNFAGTLFVGFPEIPRQELPSTQMKRVIRQIINSIKRLLENLEDDKSAAISPSIKSLEAHLKSSNNLVKWTASAVSTVEHLRQQLSEVEDSLTENCDTLTEILKQLLSEASTEEDQHGSARSWIRENMPVFIFFDVYPEMIGRMNVPEHLARVSSETRTQADEIFEKVCVVAELNLERLKEFQDTSDIVSRNLLAGEASDVLTIEIQRLWTNRVLKVRFHVDGDDIIILIAEPGKTSDIEIALNERSRGFQWFFSFYTTFEADTREGEATNAILLLDEPGLHLHAKSQGDLLGHLEKGFDNQILYTTHSPFMVPTHNLPSIRTVNFDQKKGTVVSNDPMGKGDSKTLFPLQAALGYDLAQSLFVGPNNLVVEGIIDYWILSSISEYLSNIGEVCIRPDITITPAGGAQRISYLVALLFSEKLNVVVLLDQEEQAKKTWDELVKTKLIGEKRVVFVSEGFGESDSRESDIEDLLGAKVYEDLVRESYLKELKEKELNITSGHPRVAVRFNEAFEAIGIPFNKPRPMRLLLDKMRDDPKSIVTSKVQRRFIRLFDTINSRMKK